eukprot:421275_1
MAGYLAKLIRKDLHMREIGDVHIGVGAFMALMETCHSGQTRLALYDRYLISVMNLLFDDKSTELRVLACEMFRKFISFHDQRSNYEQLNQFFSRLIALCTYSSKRQEREIELRRSGLSGMITMVHLNLDDNTVKHLPYIFPAVLCNFDCLRASVASRSNSQNDVKSDDKDDLGRLAKECLDEIASLTTLITLKSVLHPILVYLDGKEWQPLDYAVAVLLPISNCGKLQNAAIFLTELANWMSSRETIKLKTRIANVITSIVSSMRLDVGSYAASMQKLTAQLDCEDAELQEGVILCIGAYLARLPGTDALEVIADILRSDGARNARTQSTFLRAASHACLHRPPFPRDSRASEYADLLHGILIPLVRAQAQAKASETRLLVHEAFQNLLLPADFVQKENPDSPKSILFMETLGHNLSPSPQLDVRLSEKSMQLLAQGLYAELADPSSSSNSAESVEAGFRTILVAMYLGDHRFILAAMPMIFKLQSAAQMIRPSAPRHAARVQLLCVAFVLAVARLFQRHSSASVRAVAGKLDDFASKILTVRESARELSVDMELRVSVGVLERCEEKAEMSTEKVTTMLDRGDVVKILSRLPFPGYEEAEIIRIISTEFVPDTNLVSSSAADQPADYAARLSALWGPFDDQTATGLTDDPSGRRHELSRSVSRSASQSLSSPTTARSTEMDGGPSGDSSEISDGKTSYEALVNSYAKKITKSSVFSGTISPPIVGVDAHDRRSSTFQLTEPQSCSPSAAHSGAPLTGGFPETYSAGRLNGKYFTCIRNFTSVFCLSLWFSPSFSIHLLT